MQRIALKDITLSDGTVLKKNTIFAVASTCHWDSTYYPDPQKYDGYRFLKMREDPIKGNIAQFVSTSPNHLGFGHGQHACPGRFFASNEVKIIMCHILLKYDWRLAGEQKPKTLTHGFNLAADHSTKLDIRRRKEEIDLDNLKF
jgi:cytochrome P450